MQDAGVKDSMIYWCSTYIDIVLSGVGHLPPPYLYKFKEDFEVERPSVSGYIRLVVYLSLFLYPEYVVLLVLFGHFLSCAIFP